MASPVSEVTAQMEERVAALGFELVELEWAGSRRRPIIRLRVDRPEGEGSITIDECAVVSRGLEVWLDDLEDLPERYVLEVSSPGVERPLVRRRDFERFAGHEVALKGDGPLLEGRPRRLEGVLVGIAGEDGREQIRLRLPDGYEVEVPKESVRRAHLIFRWG